MAKRKSTNTKGAAVDDAFVERLANQPAQISEKVMLEIESSMASPELGIVRRAALGSLARSMPQLMEAVTSRNGAQALASCAPRIRAYAAKLGDLKQLMETAALRIDIALCDREDGLQLLQEAEAGMKAEA